LVRRSGRSSNDCFNRAIANPIGKPGTIQKILVIVSIRFQSRHRESDR
jgi:hypothetical protein